MTLDTQRIDSRADTENITFVREFLDNPEKSLAEHNDIFIENEKKKFKDYFNTVEANPLTLSQQRAVIANEENNLIIAGAGSGKTSVIVARVGYILKKEFASPEEILVLAFNRKAKEELEERIQEKLDVSIDVHTFHSFGLKVIAESQNEKPSLCRWCGDRHALNQLIRNLILDNYQKDNFRELFDQYFIQHFIPYKNQNEFKNKGDYYSYLKNFDLRTLNDEQVKSYEELEIANFLRLKNIKYEYERPYEKRTATREHKQYQPDFYLPDDKIYIEHFGVDRKGNTAPFVNAKKYRQGANWKIQQHQKHGTKLVKTYSFEKQEGCLTSNLEQKLITHGVEIGHVSFNDALSLFNEKQVFDKFSKLIVSFMNHYESNSFTVQSLKVKFSNHQSREHAFLTVFEAVYDSYLQKKSADACIDFNDMILQATKDIQQGKYLSPYKHILVDEFQDISTARSNLITELRKLVDESVVTVVGDDWQSINRFAGSDVAIMKNFQKHYGMTEVTCLENTFRFDKSICDIATKFILKNRSQIEKTVTPFNHSKKSEIYVYWYAENSDDRLGSVMKELAKKTNGEALETVYILGRYNFLEPENLRGMQNEYRRKFDISFRTVHTSKGREADHVIVFGLDSGKYGFPSEIQDDPLLNMVLTESDEFPFSEERRLFYVAMTRTKEKLFFVSNMNNRSSFIDELFADNPTEIIELNGKYRDFKLCPDCKEGSIVQRTNNQDNSTFYGCSNYPYCEYTASTLSAIPNATRQQRCDTGSNRVQTVNRKRRNIAGPNRVCNTEFVPGQIVQHDKFGLGRVKEYWDLGEDSIVVVRFNSGNTKSLMVKYAKLRNT